MDSASEFSLATITDTRSVLIRFVGNRFTMPDSDHLVSPSSPRITPPQSEFKFGTDNPCVSKGKGDKQFKTRAKRSFRNTSSTSEPLSFNRKPCPGSYPNDLDDTHSEKGTHSDVSEPLLLPSIPSTLPSCPQVKLPGSFPDELPKTVQSFHVFSPAADEKDDNKVSYFDNLGPIPSPLLYHKESREALPGIDEDEFDLARELAIACGQECPEPDFECFKSDPLSEPADAQLNAGDKSHSIAYDEQEFVGAALPDMNAAVLIQERSIVSDTDPGFYQQTRSYLRREPQAFAAVSSYQRTQPIKTTTKVHSREISPNSSNLSSFIRSREQNPAPNDPWLWNPVEPTTAEEKLLSTAISQRSTSLAQCLLKKRNSGPWNESWVNSEDDRRSTESLSQTSSIVKVPDTGAPLHLQGATWDMFGKIMNTKPKAEAEIRNFKDPWDSSTTSSSQGSSRSMRITSAASEPNFFNAPRGKCHLREGSFQSTLVSKTARQEHHIADLAAGSGVHCTALLPSKTYDHEYLGWPRRSLREEVGICYRNRTYQTLGGLMEAMEREDFSLRHQKTSNKPSRSGLSAPGGKSFDWGSFARDSGLDVGREPNSQFSIDDNCHGLHSSDVVDAQSSDLTPSADGEEKQLKGIAGPAGESLGRTVGYHVPDAASAEDANIQPPSPEEDEGYASARAELSQDNSSDFDSGEEEWEDAGFEFWV